MRTLRLAARGRPQTRFRTGVSLVRIRLWLAMLGLAVLPMVGVILLTNVLQAAPQTSTAERRAWETASAAADLTARIAELESRLLTAAADPALLQLVDGISGTSERQIATQALVALDGADGTLIPDACITSAGDGAASILSSAAAPLAAATGTSPTIGGSSACPAPDVVAQAVAAAVGDVTRATSWGADGSRHLMLTTKMAGSARRAGILTMEVDLGRLFETTPGASGIASSAVLVDMADDTIVAGSRADALAGGSGARDTRPLGNLRVHVNGILSGHTGTSRALASAGWVSTAAPLWRADDGTHLGLIHVWPVEPKAANVRLMAALAAFAIIVLLIAVVVARTFLQPFDDLARSQSQLEVLYREAREDSLHDGLTGLGNHRSFQEELDRQLELFRRHKVPVALLLMDLDDLKVVNDGEGHPAGDRLLVGMANSIRDSLRYGDRAFRIGGDEFAVILPHTDATDALVAANRLRHFCLRPAPGERVIPFSGGISSVPALAADRTEIFRQADAALYRCKRNVRGTVEVYDPDRDLVTDDSANRGAAAAVRDVIRSRSLKPVYQPIVDLRDGSVLGFEGLIRPGPSTPFSNPGQLFEAAATAGRTVELDLACFEIVAAGSAGIDVNQVVTINLSPQTLEMRDFSSAWLLGILARYRLSPGRVIVELTEREAITDLERLRRNVAALQQAGVRIAADDVGAGNAGLRLLSQVRFDIVKIDLSLVQEGTQHDSSRNVLRSILDLAGRQGAVAIAEGLETAEQLRSLRELGIITGQGYLLGRPGHNLGLAKVDIEALAAGTLIVENAPAAPRISPVPGGPEVFSTSPAGA